MCHSRRAIGPPPRRVLRCAAPAPEALTDITGEDSRSGSKAVLPCDLLRLVIDGRHWSEPPVRTVVHTLTGSFVVPGCQPTPSPHDPVDDGDVVPLVVADPGPNSRV